MISKTIGYNGVHNIFRHTHIHSIWVSKIFREPNHPRTNSREIDSDRPPIFCIALPPPTFPTSQLTRAHEVLSGVAHKITRHGNMWLRCKMLTFVGIHRSPGIKSYMKYRVKNWVASKLEISLHPCRPLEVLPLCL